MLATLYAKALDADNPASVLGDHWAGDVVRQIDYDWSTTTITARNAASVTLRSAHFDTWTRQFLAVHPQAVVLHLGCGLDSRYFRVAPGDGVDWYDVDYPEVAALREHFYPGTSRHHVVAASVTDPGWLSGIPVDRPTLVVAEGLTMYLTADQGTALLCRMVDRFSSGEMHFDTFNWLGIRAQRGNAVVRRSGAILHWAINGPQDILESVPGTRLLQWVPVFESEVFERVPAGYRRLGAVMNRIPGVRTLAQFHRYAF
ncbi:class I SAM-dependent methyltransferase [Mycolicibacterium vaccae]|uniref:O-methyltransferase domain-containing protein n=1 Tax=Mycolicibacterium vaccae ATCC 25954 TaxID=1194972 RepID=K0V043_MYCVA|nr:class I SAM-dependent methyltransferase [Mycolicibacterium vaccae]ANI42659.1 O-methyltransferase domain-containing protein [Mycolicibacterium vaccae 95051]EJZ10715.1 O-methyltransferase domain-containing protein [Mycolicibacterium vaccae ATCC 25954]MCV7062400.1 class I SAM-dependent methyltransferase [Mycolicibacterium vaccae]